LKEKSEVIYKKMINLLRDALDKHGISLNPKKLVSDFEKASIKTL
jgi:hypothetical protein